MLYINPVIPLLPMKPLLWLCIAMCFILSCTRILDEMRLAKASNKSILLPAFVEYKIQKGNHYAEGSTFKQIHHTELRFEVVFDSSAIYENIKSENQYDINKLYGFSDCNTAHHENSARFGWRWNGNSIEIHAYWYNDSTRYHQFLDTVSKENPYELAIQILPQQYGFEIKNRTRFVPRHCNSATMEGYRLYPYFGGDEAAPHDIRIRIKDL